MQMGRNIVIARPWWTQIDRLILFAFIVGTGFLSAFNAQRIMGVVMIAALFVQLGFVKKGQVLSPRRHPPEIILYTLWVLWSGVTGIILSVSFELFWAIFKVTAQMAVMIWAIYGLLRIKSTPQAVFWSLFVCGSIQMVAAMMGVTQTMDQSSEAQITGFANNPNVLGFTVVLGAMAGLLLWNERTALSWLRKIIFMGIVAGSGYTAALSGSRKTVLIYGLLILVWALFVLPRGRGLQMFGYKVLAVVLLTVVLVAAIPFIMEHTSFGVRWNQFIEEGGGDLRESWRSNVRYEMYLAGFQMFLSKPITGVGLGQFQALFVTGQYSHSDIIETLSTTGLVGFVLYQSYYVLLIARCVKLIRLTRDPLEVYQYRTIILAVVVVFLFGLGSPHINSQPVFAFFAALSAYTWTKLLEKSQGVDVMSHRPLVAARGHRGFAPQGHW